jgi:hypothetical protein
MNNNRSQIITFYSYKGGVGRSMALANVAWLMATKYHKEVLIIDWDLEAPGLHRFFGFDDKDVRYGLMDLLNDYKNLLRQKTPSLSKDLIYIKKYILPVRDISGNLSIIPAGRLDSDYENRVNEFNWDNFYEKWHGFKFIEYLKKELKKKAEIILVDSRTGLTDIGGICTMQLPDVDVLLFALNHQNLAGIETATKKIIKRSMKVAERNRTPLLIHVPSRVEIAGGQDKKIFWEQEAANRLWEYLPGKDIDRALLYIKKFNIPYIGDYSYGETPLAVDKDPLGDLAESFDRLTKSILNDSESQGEEIWKSNYIYTFSKLAMRKFNAILWSKKTLIFILIFIALIGGWQYFKVLKTEIQTKLDKCVVKTMLLEEKNKRLQLELERALQQQFKQTINK